MKFAISAKPVRPLPIAGRLLLILFTLFSGYGQAQETNGTVTLQADDSGIAARSWVDRTALYPGDMINYHIEIQTNNTTDILTEDLFEDELGMDGLELVSSDLEQRVSEEGSYYHARYRLTSFEYGRPLLGIEPMSIRYYHKRPGQRLEDVVTAGEISLSAMALSLSSTLPGEQDALALRDSAGYTGNPLSRTHAGIYGILLILVAAIPLGLVIRNRQRSSTLNDDPDLEEMLGHSYSKVEELRDYDAQDEEQRRSGFSEVETIIKEYLETTAGIAAQALTADEIIRQLADRQVVIEELFTVLECAETARYGGHNDLPSPEALEHSINFAQGLLSSR
jgi:hypothetical protein